MIDLHSHICFGIDDGSKTIEESTQILKEMSENGITDIFLTPHYIEGSKYIADNKKKKEIINELKQIIEEENLNINLYEGNEVYLTDNCLELIKKKKIMTLNNSKYILLELPMFEKNPNVRTIMHNLIVAGYIPIIAHPERYSYLDKNLDYLKDLYEIGVLFQGNYQSLFGKYGKFAKKNLQKLLKLGMISFIGSDIHHLEDLHTNKIYKEIKKYVKKDNLTQDILENNAKKIIEKS